MGRRALGSIIWTVLTTVVDGVARLLGLPWPEAYLVVIVAGFVLALAWVVAIVAGTLWACRTPARPRPDDRLVRAARDVHVDPAS